ncbi:hypothetical protein E4T56_gene3372 [Termitomyces sp. T112]|nr:hypothetical protein E4T56_gene3372 [Termitomyces sp. T112]
MPLPPTDAPHQAAGILRLVLFRFSSARFPFTSCMIELLLPKVALTAEQVSNSSLEAPHSLQETSKPLSVTFPPDLSTSRILCLSMSIQALPYRLWPLRTKPGLTCYT